MIYNPLDNRGLYNIYDLGMCSLQPFSDICHNLAKGFNRMSENFDLPINWPFMSDSEKADFKAKLEQIGSGYRRLAADFYMGLNH